MLLAVLFAASALHAPPLQTAPPQPALIAPEPQIPRGRDPWVFRCIFEDRTRMVILAPAPGLWVAFNPATCAVQKVWQGKMNFRGKVWDFSQDNCAADGQVLAEAPSVICSLPDAPLARQSDSSISWTTDHAEFHAGRMWTFDKDNASITSSIFDLSGWRNVYAAFDETSRGCPFRVALSADGGATWDAQYFDSTMSGSSDTDWQWNFKLLTAQPREAKIRITSPSGAAKKTLRNFRLFGDKPAWSVRKGEQVFPLVCQWRGYSLDPLSQGCVLRYALRLPDSSEISVEHEIEASSLAFNNTVTLSERLVVHGVPASTALLRAMPLSNAVAVYRFGGDAANAGSDDRPIVEFKRSGSATVTSTFTTRGAQ